MSFDTVTKLTTTYSGTRLVRVYTAGPMKPGRVYGFTNAKKIAHGGSRYAPWRVSLSNRVEHILRGERFPVAVSWLHPEDLVRRDHCDGTTANEVAEADLDGVERAGLVAAYLAGPERYGTLVEIGYAVGRGTPVALVERGPNGDDQLDTCACSDPKLSRYWFARGAVRHGGGRRTPVVSSNTDDGPIAVLAEIVVAYLKGSLVGVAR